MVQIASRKLQQGASWIIHITSNPEPKREKGAEMEHFTEAIQAAQCEDQNMPAWMQVTALPSKEPGRVTQRAINVYMLSKKQDGEMGGIGWWQTANGYTAMALHDLWSGEHCNYDALCTAIRQCEARHKNFINTFNDDTLWWAMLCVHMYNIKWDEWFHKQAQIIWKHVKHSVCERGEVFFQGRDMEGAVFWNIRPEYDQINAITTGLFAELSIRLALLVDSKSQNSDVSRDQYIEAAKCSLGWILRCRYRPREGLVLDNIRLRDGKVNDWIFTYNTGVALGVCTLLFEATAEGDYMILARHMAMKAMTRKRWVEDDGVLTEKGAYGRGTHDPWKPNDAIGFKSILIRHLRMLYNVVDQMHYPDPKSIILNDVIERFININFRSQLERNTNRRGQYGPWWAGPFECPTSHAQMAVLDVMAAVKLVHR